MKKYQAIISFDMDEEFMTLVPSHRTYINHLLTKGVIETYTVSMETQQSWIVVNANTKFRASRLHREGPRFEPVCSHKESSTYPLDS